MGLVWEGFDQWLQRPVAIKVLRADLLEDGRSAQALARFHREGQAAARLNHHNIAVVHASGKHREQREDGTETTYPFLVLEYLEGRDLGTVLEQDHPGGLPIADVLEYGAQVCDGLAVAHDEGIVHRDIKPANLMLPPDGTVKICDFGIAHLQDAAFELTGTGVQPGTPAYMAPEQICGRQVDHRADLYALGASLYLLLTGRTVFPAGNLPALIAMHMNTRPDPPSAHRVGIPARLDALVLNLLDKEPSRRPASAAQVAVLLRDCAAHDPGCPPTGAPLPPPTLQIHSAHHQAARPAPSANTEKLVRLHTACSQHLGAAPSGLGEAGRYLVTFGFLIAFVLGGINSDSPKSSEFFYIFISTLSVFAVAAFLLDEMIKSRSARTISSVLDELRDHPDQLKLREAQATHGVRGLREALETLGVRPAETDRHASSNRPW
ncbi:hypothetical protein GCM10009550_57910 [Actinocorallia libanotica]|uniref:non-specific serine/threonine protein kinase n=2 Tax=Actinocorallia libanotica TaxID=46162 RepID=A0ABN1RTN4_9ACTN